jgi:hypothetical protein
MHFDKEAPDGATNLASYADKEKAFSLEANGGLLLYGSINPY